MHSLVSKKATNKEVLFNGRLSNLVIPHNHNGDLYIVRDLYVGKSGYLLKDLDISGNLTVHGDSSLRDTDILGDLTVNGDSSLRDTDISGNLIVYRTISARQYNAGQVIRTSMFNNSELSQTEKIMNAGVTTTIFSFSYTPSNTMSYLLLEYQTIYLFGGSDSDEIYAYLYVNDGVDNVISTTYQHWLNGAGGGSRSGTIFPIVGRYTNTNMVAKQIHVNVYNHTDDILTIQSNNSTWLKITEIGR